MYEAHKKLEKKGDKKLKNVRKPVCDVFTCSFVMLTFSSFVFPFSFAIIRYRCRTLGCFIVK